MKELLEDIKLSRVAYLLEKIEKKETDEKIKAFKKLEKMKITKKIGLFLIENSIRDYGLYDEFGGVNSSIIELCFKKYYYEYNSAIEKAFKNLSKEAQNRVLILLTTIDDNNTLNLYVELILKYYKDREIIPIGNLTDKPLLYPYLFPKLYKVLKYSSKRNNILILINSYLNSGVVTKEDLKKHKKILTDSIINLFNEALKFKFKNTYEALHDKEYRDLRFFLEIAINIESYISGKKTREYLDKLLKKNDNQLKLFILDNYFKNQKNIEHINFNSIARDKASRYALFELLTIYEKIDLMPKKYLNQKLLAESDFYTNFLIISSYANEPENIEFYKKINDNGYDYYVYKFSCKYKYNNYSNDYLTTYICSQIGIEKYNNKEVVSNFVGISGGYDPNIKSSIVIKPLSNLLFDNVDEKNIDNVIENLIDLKNNKLINQDETTSKKQKNHKDKSKAKNEKKFNSKKNRIEKVFKLKKNKIKKEKPVKLKKEKVKKDRELKNYIDQNNEITGKKNHIFTYFLLFLFAVFLGLLIYCILYIYGVGSINDGVDEEVIKAVELKDKGNFTEIMGTEIFNQEEAEYFVLLYKKGKNEKNKYYRYINEYSKRDYRFYYVDLNNGENKFLYGPNELGFTLVEDRLLKVKDHEFEYFVDGKKNILNEMQLQIETIINQEQQALKEEKKAKEKVKKQKNN